MPVSLPFTFSPFRIVEVPCTLASFATPSGRLPQRWSHLRTWVALEALEQDPKGVLQLQATGALKLL